MGSRFITRLYESPHPYQNGGVEREGRKERELVDEISGYRLYKADSILHPKRHSVRQIRGQKPPTPT